MSIYEKIVEQDDSEAEAHWGIVLCRYGIEYVEDPATKKRIPTCHRTLYEAVTTDPDYQAAIDYSDTLQQTIYEKEAKEIDKIQKNILAIVQKEEPFDVFICYKETDENGNRTKDSVIANDIYHQLTQEGFKVFYAAITLEDKLGQEYEPYIFAALTTAKVMLVIGSKPEYFNAVWVRNEWSRFLNLMKTDKTKLLIPCYKDMDAYELPEEFAHLQAQDMGKIGFINDVIRGIKKVVVNKENNQTHKENETITTNNEGSNVSALLKRAFLFLEDEDWSKADEYCERVLDIDPENAEAYLGKLMSELQVQKRSELANCGIVYTNNKNYLKAVKYGDEKLKAELKDYINSDTEIEVPSKTFRYGEFEDGYSLEGIIDKKVESINIPEKYRGKPVTRIGFSVFKDCINLTSITIPESVTSIGKGLFKDCTNLTNITILGSVTSITDFTFEGCENLTSITIPESVTSIGNSAFWGCKKLASIIIPGSVTSIGDNVFYFCEKLTSIIIPEGVTSIGEYAFAYCKNLTSITIPESVSSIGNSAFRECKNIASIIIPGSVTSIGESAFYGCTNLTNITIPESVTSIGDNVFHGCTNLTSITIPESVTSIGDNVFHDCTNLASITIPESVTSIGVEAFRRCENLTSIIIPEGVTSIGKSAFGYCKNLISITIPESVTNIGEFVFSGCDNLKTIFCTGDYNIVKATLEKNNGGKKIINYLNSGIYETKRLIEEKERVKLEIKRQERIEQEKLEQKRKEQEKKKKEKEQYEEEQETLQTELANLRGLFTGKRRKEIEARLAELQSLIESLN
ncbi:MAG: leucine-rich repeat protein [Lachnospiraceae bacterium]|nr:leucine-rich repeat protein [Lachnospiraceae bacterium]